MKLKDRRLLTAGRIFGHPAYIAIAAISTIVFFYIFRYLISVNNHGIFFLLLPMYVVYLLVLTSGVLFSISLFAIAYSVASRRLGEIGGLEGLIIPSLGGLVAAAAARSLFLNPYSFSSESIHSRRLG